MSISVWLVMACCNPTLIITPRGWPKWWRPWSWRYDPFKVQGSTPLECKQFLGATPSDEKPAIYPDLCRETSEGTVHGFCGISRSACKLAQTPKIKKKKNPTLIMIILFLFGQWQSSIKFINIYSNVCVRCTVYGVCLCIGF